MQLFWVDAFTSTVGKGNPAAVVPLDSWLPDATLQSIALENGLSETAFFVRVDEETFHLRWMTPEQEVDLCGHATLATAHVIFTQFTPRSPTVTFRTLSGPLKVTQCGEGRYTMAFPSRPPVPVADIPLELLEGLGLAKEDVLFCGKARDFLVELKSPLAVSRVIPKYDLLNKVDALCIIISARGDDGTVDVVSRVFCPNCGVPEDPVTGSAHCTVAPYFADKLGRSKLVALQASQRSGILELELSTDLTTVSITGNAVLYLSGVVKGVAGPPTPPLPTPPIATFHAISTILNTLAEIHAKKGKKVGNPAVPSTPILPCVTLTYAQSLDGSLAAVRGVPTPISCPTSLLLTHRLRAAHDGILVGYPTVLSDNPGLTVRLCPGVSPTVVVIDPDLRCPPGCRLFGGGGDSIITPPPHHPIILYHGEGGGEGFEERRAALLAVGAHLLKVPLLSSEDGDSGRQLDLEKGLQALALPPFSLRSVLVEGGAGVHHSFLSQHSRGGERGLVSAVVVTVAPLYLRSGLHIGGEGGQKGGGNAPSPPPPFPLSFVCSEKVGSDLVLVAQPL